MSAIASTCRFLAKSEHNCGGFTKANNLILLLATCNNLSEVNPGFSHSHQQLISFGCITDGLAIVRVAAQLWFPYPFTAS